MSPSAWMAGRGWVPHPFQQEVWQACSQGLSGLLHATTGSGKTHAVWLGLLQRLGAEGQRAAPRVLWVTPMRALAADTVLALREPLEGSTVGWRVEARTGDTSSAQRARQERLWPQALVTTPETLSLLLTRKDSSALLGRVEAVVVDEWHELIGSKRGVQLQLALARLARWNSKLMIWGLSATLGNLQQALATLVSPLHGAQRAVLVQGRLEKALTIDTLLPEQPGRFSWGGHLGAQMLGPVLREIESSATTLVFTNTRSQAEMWYQLLLRERPQWAGVLALHHGSLDLEVRRWVESGLKAGQLKAVVATSSLDLGVDFLPVERVLQVGSAKGVARLLQRAGRSGHAPGRASRVTLVPTNTLELVEAVAARRAVAQGRLEARCSPEQPMDVLVQHLVTVALGGGFHPDELYDEVRRTTAYAGLERDSFEWALAFVKSGGQSLGAYPQHHRVQEVDGLWVVSDASQARRHRMQVGTIVSDAGLQVKWLSGGTLGTVEESFIARLAPGDCFVFAGRLLELVRTREMTAYVRKAAKSRGVVTVWAGSKMPLSTEMADACLSVLAEADQEKPGPSCEPELLAAWPMLSTQRAMSHLPRPGMVLLEVLRTREGQHLFLYPFAGRQVHSGLAQLLAWRLAGRQDSGASFSLAVNDMGLEILTSAELALPEEGQVLKELLLSPHAGGDLEQEIGQSLQAGQLPQRRFREIARIAGLVSAGHPGQRRSARQIQASSGLFYEVFRRYDSSNRLLQQAQQEVLRQELDLARLRAAVGRLGEWPWVRVALRAPSPFCLPLMVERLREQLSTEQLAARIERWVAQSQSVADEPGRPRRPPRRGPRSTASGQNGSA